MPASFQGLSIKTALLISQNCRLQKDMLPHGSNTGRGLPGQEQIAAEDPEQGSGTPSVEVQGRQGASSLGHQDQVGPAEAWLGPADGL